MQQRFLWGLFLGVWAWRKLVLSFWVFLAGAVLLLASSEHATRRMGDGNLFSKSLDPEYGVGYWIWTTNTYDHQSCRFWKRVDIPKSSPVASAVLTITADDSYSLYVDGREVGQGAEWKFLTEYDLTLILGPGPHILAVECFNEYRDAGLVGGLRIQMQDGQTINVPTDSSWKIVPNTEKNWMERNEADPSWLAAVAEAKVSERGWAENKQPRIFRQPPIQPLIVTFWQSGLFRTLMFLICGVLAALCFWLIGKLAIYAQAQQVVRRERARIARDIHDDLTAGLTQLVLFGEVSQSRLVEGSEARLQVAKVCEKARSLSQSMNDIIWMVNSQRDTFGDFISYVCNYAETFLATTPIRCRFDIEDDIPDLACDLGVRRNLFLGIKEALNNALKHSGATELLLRIHCHSGQMIVSIEDNGKGFDSASIRTQGNGLSNMTVRATEAGGVCRIVSQPGAGCRVAFLVPLARKRKLQWKFWRQRRSVWVPMSLDQPSKDI